MTGLVVGRPAVLPEGMGSAKPRSSPGAPRVRAVLIADGNRSAFDAFEVDSLNERGALLRGPLLLEVGEELLLELECAGELIDATAVVVGIDLVRQELQVEFRELSPADGERLAAISSAADAESSPADAGD